MSKSEKDTTHLEAPGLAPPTTEAADGAAEQLSDESLQYATGGANEFIQLAPNSRFRTAEREEIVSLNNSVFDEMVAGFDTSNLPNLDLLNVDSRNPVGPQAVCGIDGCKTLCSPVVDCKTLCGVNEPIPEFELGDFELPGVFGR